MLSLLKPHTRDVGGFEVRRVLPGFPHKMVGPFIFFDHMGPVTFAPGEGVDVRPHPHIGLATVTYLFEGALLHRDSLGIVQRIEPGDVNWMTAGGGIVHSERTAPDDRARGHRLHGIQSWVALPKSHEQTSASFNHTPKAALPVIPMPGVEMRLIAGSAFGARAPTPVYSDIFYLAVEMTAGSAFEVPAEHEERGVYVVEGDVRVAGEAVPQEHLVVVQDQSVVQIAAATATRLMLLGGAKMDGDRIIWWNFVASSRDLLEDAKARWRDQHFPKVPGETEFIPLPEK